jgi:nitrogen fixation-related uncharacterized protein
VAVAIALFIGGVVMGIAGALMWAWAVRTGQLRDLERSKHQLFWPDIAEPHTPDAKPTTTELPEARRT